MERIVSHTRSIVFRLRDASHSDMNVVRARIVKMLYVLAVPVAMLGWLWLLFKFFSWAIA